MVSLALTLNKGSSNTRASFAESCNFDFEEDGNPCSSLLLLLDPPSKDRSISFFRLFSDDTKNWLITSDFLHMASTGSHSGNRRSQNRGSCG
jgi:hypothetical protein